MANVDKILVIGGGISGITAAVEAAEVGHEVVLVEKEAFLGGRTIRMNRYFPKMCPPSCGMEINFKRIRNNPRIAVHTLAEVTRISGQAGSYEVTVRIRPRYVLDRAQIPTEVLEKLSGERPNEFNQGLDSTKALYLPHPMAFPMQYVLDIEALSAEDRALLESECPAGSFDFEMAAEDKTFQVGSIVIAAGWQPYDAAKVEPLGFRRHANVINNVMMERLASITGPTEGKLLRPSDGKEAKNVAFAQCVGSRDENHLPYCSAVCCMGTLKQARYVLEASPDANVTIFYIDIRTISRHEKFYYDLLADERVRFVKGKVAKIVEDPETKDPRVEVEDTLTGSKMHDPFDLVVLATGMVPNTAESKIPFDAIQYDEYGFVQSENGASGIFAAGCVQRPVDVARSVRQATGAALKAIQSL